MALNPAVVEKDYHRLPDKQKEAVEKLYELMNKPIEYYNSERMATEMDLVDKVRELFIKNGVGHLLKEAYEESRFIIEARSRPSHAQQYLLNRWISLQLMAKDNADPLLLYSLVYEIRPDQWLRIFEQYILPNMLSLDLPMPLKEDSHEGQP